MAKAGLVTSAIQNTKLQQAVSVDKCFLLSITDANRNHLTLLVSEENRLHSLNRRQSQQHHSIIWTYIHTYNHFTALLDFVQDYPGETVLERDSERQWHLLSQMQICTLTQTDNHASIPPLSFLQARCSSCHPTNSVKALDLPFNIHLLQSHQNH